ncbi:MauE/DoxX family redox-associated membrane protein [Mucilaginibacter sp. SJ]|uniref:MauE/DoxX family redox-associated membrane protein n=1 Tax=Mucilaginibacter sp. SJ TaxID=3029053 RepID=UPI00406BED5D
MRVAIIYTAQFLLILLWLYTASSKLFQYELFRQSLDRQHFSSLLTHLLYWALPAAELGCAACILSTRTLRLGFWISETLLTIFTVYIILVLLNFFENVPCSCGGVIEMLTWKGHLFFNLFFIVVNTLGLISLAGKGGQFSDR